MIFNVGKEPQENLIAETERHEMMCSQGLDNLALLFLFCALCSNSLDVFSVLIDPQLNCIYCHILETVPASLIC